MTEPDRFTGPPRIVRIGHRFPEWLIDLFVALTLIGLMLALVSLLLGDTRSALFFLKGMTGAGLVLAAMLGWDMRS